MPNDPEDNLDLPTAGIRPQPKCIARTEPSSVNWLWNNRIAFGQITVLAGNPGLGKSLITLDIAARVTTGRPWPDEPPDAPPRPPANVMLIGEEDNLAQTILPRLVAAGADLNRVFTPDYFVLEGRLQFPRDGERLGFQLLCIENTRLVIMDPLLPVLDDSCFAGGRQAYTAMDEIKNTACMINAAIIAVVHLTKADYRSAIHRVPGGNALAAVARAIFAVVPDRREENPDPRRCLLIPLKNNLAPPQPSLAYTVDEGRILWQPETLPCCDPDSLLSIPARRPGPDPVKLEACMRWLTAQLQAGPQPRARLLPESLAAGFSLPTLNRARTALRIKSIPAPANSTLWSMS